MSGKQDFSNLIDEFNEDLVAEKRRIEEERRLEEQRRVEEEQKRKKEEAAEKERVKTAAGRHYLKDNRKKLEEVVEKRRNLNLNVEKYYIDGHEIELDEQVMSEAKIRRIFDEMTCKMMAEYNEEMKDNMGGPEEIVLNFRCMMHEFIAEYYGFYMSFLKKFHLEKYNTSEEWDKIVASCNYSTKPLHLYEQVLVTVLKEIEGNQDKQYVSYDYTNTSMSTILQSAIVYDNPGIAVRSVKDNMINSGIGIAASLANDFMKASFNARQKKKFRKLMKRLLSMSDVPECSLFI